MPRLPVLVALLLLVLLGAVAAPSPAHGGAWRWPLRGPVATSFQVGADRFAAGQHRGIDILAPAGTPVRAACSGRVRFAGDVAAAGPTVAVACGPLTATYLHLGALAVHAGQRVAAGDRLGAVGADVARDGPAAPHLHFGVRRTARRFGYLDPLALLPMPGDGARRPLPPAVRRRVPLALPHRGPAGRPEPAARPALARRPATAPVEPHALPGGAVAIRLGLLLIGVALPSWGGALMISRRRSRRSGGLAPTARRTARRAA